MALSIFLQVQYNQYDFASKEVCGCSMLDDMNALVQFAHAGSIVGAADRLHRTPSAVTRQIQRLEAALGSKLLDRLVKPPRLTPLGVRVVEHSRDVFKSIEDLKSFVKPDAEPQGLFRIGVSHVLADDELVNPIRDLTRKFKKLRVNVLTDLTNTILEKIKKGELDAAVVVMPESHMASIALPKKIVGTDRMAIVTGASRPFIGKPTWQKLAEQPWILSPQGCIWKNLLFDRIGQSGASALTAAEVHNAHLQLAFVKAGLGLGFLPRRFVQRHAGGGVVRIVDLKDFQLRINTAVINGGAIGSLEDAVRYLEAAVTQVRSVSSIKGKK